MEMIQLTSKLLLSRHVSLLGMFPGTLKYVLKYFLG